MPLILINAGCTSFNNNKDVITSIEYVTPNIIIQPRPRRVNMANVKFHVVTEKNLNQFIDDFREKYGEVVFVSMSVKGYERLALNIQDIRRYINQQNKLIVYYETAISEASQSVTEKNNSQNKSN